MSKIYLIIFVVFIGIFGALTLKVLMSSPQKNTMNNNAPAQVMDDNNEEVRATFKVVTNGTVRDFGNSMYHNLSPEVYIASENPDEVIVKGEKTWDDFFKTLPFTLTKECLTTGTGQTFCTNSTKRLKFVINDKEDPDALDRIIKDGDSLVVEY